MQPAIDADSYKQYMPFEPRLHLTGEVAREA